MSPDRCMEDICDFAHVWSIRPFQFQTWFSFQGKNHFRWVQFGRTMIEGVLTTSGQDHVTLVSPFRWSLPRLQP
jgi:hypothetical protein